LGRKCPAGNDRREVRGWDTFDLFRSEAAATVRSFKHDLAEPAAPPEQPAQQGSLRVVDAVAGVSSPIPATVIARRATFAMAPPSIPINSPPQLQTS